MCFCFYPELLQDYGAESVEIPHLCWEVAAVTNGASADRIICHILSCFSRI